MEVDKQVSKEQLEQYISQLEKDVTFYKSGNTDYDKRMLQRVTFNLVVAKQLKDILEDGKE